jgi:hypothetical protein
MSAPARDAERRCAPARRNLAAADLAVADQGRQRRDLAQQFLHLARGVGVVEGGVISIGCVSRPR